jgi:hypothetical protein
VLAHAVRGLADLRRGVPHGGGDVTHAEERVRLRRRVVGHALDVAGDVDDVDAQPAGLLGDPGDGRGAVGGT